MAHVKSPVAELLAVGLLLWISGCGGVVEDGESDGLDPSFESDAVPARPPVRSAAHGALILPDGSSREPSVDFALAAQPYYVARLMSEADEPTRKAFEAVRRVAAERLAAGGEARAAATAELIAWLIAKVQPKDAARLASINAALVRRFRASPADLTGGNLETAEPGVTREAFVTSTYARGQQYVDVCRASGVPIPPPWGSGSWVDRGAVFPDFLGLSFSVKVYTFESESPRGLCMALPRYNEDLFGNATATFLGVICQGNDTSKACFWDLRDDLDIPLNSSHEIAVEATDVFVGGGDLPALGNGICSDCHAGENAFIVHPYTSALDRGQKLYAKGWVNPLVVPEWPQNRRPGRDFERFPLAPGEQSCLECHNKKEHRRFPRLTGGLEEYCETVATSALMWTMPPAPRNPLLYLGHAGLITTGCRDFVAMTRFGGSFFTAEFFSNTTAEDVHVGDFNNDGRTDLLKFVFGTPSDVYVSLMNGNRYGTPAKWHDNFAGNRHGTRVGDFNGDGMDDIMRVFNSDNVFEVALALQGGGFGASTRWWNGSTPVFGAHMVGDVNNDGKDDVIMPFGRTVASASSTDVYVALANTAGTGFNTPAPFATGFAVSNARYDIGDVNGDGFEDLVKFTQGTTADVFVLLSRGSGFEPEQKWHDSFAGGTEMPRVADVTGDGMDDIVTFTKGSTGDVYVAASNGSSFGARALWHPFFASGSPVILMGDMNADNDADAIAIYQNAEADVFSIAAVP